MKMFYTPDELKKLSSKELLELTTFGGADNVYYFSDLEKVMKEGTEYSFHFKDKSVIYTQQEETFEAVKLGKARFDMITKSLEQNEEQNKREEAFFSSMKEMVSNQMDNTNKATENNRREIAELLVTLNENNSRTISNIEHKLEETATRWQKQVDKLDKFDIKAYNVRMNKLNEIIEAFDKLLAE